MHHHASKRTIIVRSGCGHTGAESNSNGTTSSGGEGGGRRRKFSLTSMVDLVVMAPLHQEGAREAGDYRSVDDGEGEVGGRTMLHKTFHLIP